MLDMRIANAGTAMCHDNFSHWCAWRDENGVHHHLSGYLRKSDLWEDMRNMGATKEQVKVAKEWMKQAPTKRMYTGR